jgi:signal peptide peptidase SppA
MRPIDDIYLLRAESVDRLCSALTTTEKRDMPDPVYRGMAGRKVGVIRASGVVVRENEAGFYGYLDATALADAVEEMDEDDSVNAILMIIDSPGGMCNGTPEAAERIAAVNKPVVVWTPGLLCSAAYWIAASADAILATPSSTVGNVGAYIMHYDLSAIMEAMGVKVELFSSGALKAVGAPGFALTEAQREHIQSRVDSIASSFFDFVSTYRTNASIDIFDGRDVLGKDAEDMGLIDALVYTEEEAVEFAAGLAS